MIENKIEYVICVLIGIIGFITLWFLAIASQKEVFVDIPDKNQINSFCASHNYEYGWLDSNKCQKNQVMCYKKVGKYALYDCVDWKTVKQK